MNSLLKNKAFGLIEVLIATVILAVGLLGIAILQQKSMNLTRDNENYATAAMIATEISNRMQSNYAEARKGSNSTYVNSYASIIEDPGDSNYLKRFRSPAVSPDLTAHADALNSLLANKYDCYSTTGGCTTQILAAIDLFDWKFLIKTALPNGKGIVCLDSSPELNKNSLTCDGTNPAAGSDPPAVLYTIKIRWTDLSNTDRTFMTQVTIPIRRQELASGQWKFGSNSEQFIVAKRTGDRSYLNKTSSYYTYHDVEGNITCCSGSGSSIRIPSLDGKSIYRTDSSNIDTHVTSALNVLSSSSGMRLMNTCLYSNNNAYKICQQGGDGHLVTYRLSDGAPIWATGVYGSAYAYGSLKMQTDGNLVARKVSGTVYWATGTNGQGPGPYRAVLQDDNNFVIYDANSVKLWETGVH